LVSLKEKTCNPKKNVSEDDDSEQNPNTSLKEDLKGFSIRNLIHLVHKLHRTQNSINAYSLQNEEQHEHQTPSCLNLHIQLSSPFSENLSEYQMFMAQCSVNFILCSNIYKRDEQKVLFILTLLYDTALFWALSIMKDPKHSFQKNFATFKEEMDCLYKNKNFKHF
jgi:hypothetical protein